MKRTLLAMSAIAYLLMACGGDEPTKPKVEPLNISGKWTGTGMSASARSVSFELVLSHTNNSVNGTGKYQISGSLSPTSFNVTGTCFVSGELSLFFGSTLIDFDGTATATQLRGKIKNGGMQEGATTFFKN